MKIKLTYLFTLLLIVSMSVKTSAQDSPIDFETPGIGAAWTWEVFENVDNPPLEIIPNPDASGVNTSGTVAKFIARVDGAPWAGFVTRNISVFTLNETNCTVKIMVWKSVISDVGIKFEANFASTGEIKIANTLVNQWEEITFDFSGKIGEPSSTNIDGLVIFPDFTTRTTENVAYIDNITFSPKNSTSLLPTIAAPTPTLPAANVISLFSNAYTNVNVDTWSAVWDQADLTDVQIEGNDAKQYTNLVYAGIEFTSQTIDATSMTNFHMDFWTPDPTSLPAVFKIKLVDFGADGGYAGGDDVEHELTFDANSTPQLISNQWVAFDIPLSEFTGLTTKAHLAQMIISGDPNTIFIDNVYFHNSTTDVKELIGAVPSGFNLDQNYPNPFNPTTKISFSLPEANNVSLRIYNTLGQEVQTLISQFMNAGTYEISFDAFDLPAGIYLYSFNAGSFQSVKKMMLIK